MSVPLGVKFAVWLTVAALLPWAVFVISPAVFSTGSGALFGMLCCVFISAPLAGMCVVQMKTHLHWELLVMAIGLNFFLTWFAGLALVLLGVIPVNMS